MICQFNNITSTVLKWQHVKEYVNTKLYYKIDIFLLCQKQKYAPSVFEKYATTITLGGKVIKLNLYDTAGKFPHQKSPPTISFHCVRAGLFLYNVKRGHWCLWWPHTVSSGLNIIETLCRQRAHILAQMSVLMWPPQGTLFHSAPSCVVRKIKLILVRSN